MLSSSSGKKILKERGRVQGKKGKTEGGQIHPVPLEQRSEGEAAGQRHGVTSNRSSLQTRRAKHWLNPQSQNC